ncbi:acyl-CoA thioesterase [Leptolinea tardivitalis]|uniref:Acyl-CoA hydrolase n=1 Tax=Leptolinea tardivitalis TaxID=229920 RepID=A0A0P6X9S0_9CHLR|nr:hotdog domain-containing protein [Leptolinea tardivitalis]KPL71260.1 acyl-CoA hydrolase [Leptolinea tardivitalis]GAP23024.1 acyl-CoA hydrolase [Leptolinea tardivitalis]
MEPVCNTSNHLVKSEDLNHHGTLYAGRSAEWFVEAGFIAAARIKPPDSIVCLKIHGMTFSRPVHCGEIITYNSKIIYAGTTSMVAFIDVWANQELVVKGFITFIHVDENSKPIPHGIVIEPSTEEDRKLQETAIALTRKK